jgi:hypothetical protein
MRRKAKPERRVRLVCGELVVTIGSDEHRYRLTAVPAEGGKAFRLEKAGLMGDCYTVVLSGDGRHTCTCLGNVKRGACKHVSAMVALAAAGKLAGFFVA